MPPLLLTSDYSEKLCEAIDAAKSEIFIMMFEWRWYDYEPSNPVSMINHALIRAVRRGVVVKAFVNGKEILETLRSQNIKVKQYQRSKLMHAKVVILDRKLVCIGSHNFTSSAMLGNVELSMLFETSEIAEKLVQFFENLWSV
jgi:phosphatidylserine/phosphatidylglycerophosphate/cardiolipin synthase-like enzyme